MDQAAVSDEFAGGMEDDRAPAKAVGLVACHVAVDPSTGAVAVKWLSPQGERVGVSEEHAHLVEVTDAQRAQRQPSRPQPQPTGGDAGALTVRADGGRERGQRLLVSRSPGLHGFAPALRFRPR